MPPEAVPNTPPAGNAAPPNPAGTFLATPNPTPPQPTDQPPGTPPTNPYAKEDWRHTLPDDVRMDENIKTIHDVPSLVKSFINAQKMIGNDKVPLPGKHATDDDIQAFYDKIGRPPLDKYEVKMPKDAKFIDPEWMNELKPMAHKLGVMPAQLEKIAEWYEQKTAGAMKTQVEASQKEVDKQIASLKDEWGVAHDQKASYARQVFEKLLDPQAQEWLNKTGVGNSVHLIKTFAKIGEMLYKEDTIAEGPSGKQLFSPNEATKKANEILADMKHPYNNPEHPNHINAVQEVKELFDMSHPKKQS